MFPILMSSIKRWANLQDPNKLSAVDLQKTIDQLVPEEFLPLYFHHQNAAILIEIESFYGAKRTVISAWQVLLSTKNITSSLLPHFSCFSVPVFQLQDRFQLRSMAHCELLIDFMKHPLEHSQAHRGSGTFDETRDVPGSHYATDWWINHFSGIRSENRRASSISFKKKHRDQIQWNGALLPFRRSGL
ncbi:unnamed protein product [Rotaria sp. Silwood2]|nr:unnamed protein product [Rotaria sp. Silwood2]CAF4646115.1 unnamed protein product [Rotaria sp. Silwood2]